MIAKPGFGSAAVRELGRCHKLGASGAGEPGDKGLGLTDKVLKKVYHDNAVKVLRK